MASFHGNAALPFLGLADAEFGAPRGTFCLLVQEATDSASERRNLACTCHGDAWLMDERIIGELFDLACAYVFFFSYPCCAFYWLRFQRARGPGITNLFIILALALMALLGCL